MQTPQLSEWPKQGADAAEHQGYLLISCCAADFDHHHWFRFCILSLIRKLEH
jgi:hypothetical protein